MPAPRVQKALQTQKRRTLFLLALLPLLAGCAATPSLHGSVAQPVAKAAAPARSESSSSAAPTVTVTVTAPAPKPTPTMDTAGGDPGINDGGGNAGINDGGGSASAAAPAPSSDGSSSGVAASLPPVTYGDPVPASCPGGTVTIAVTRYDESTVYGWLRSDATANLWYQGILQGFAFGQSEIQPSMDGDPVLKPGETRQWSAMWVEPSAYQNMPPPYTFSATQFINGKPEPLGVEWEDASYKTWCYDSMPGWIVVQPKS